KSRLWINPTTDLVRGVFTVTTPLPATLMSQRSSSVSEPYTGPLVAAGGTVVPAGDEDTSRAKRRIRARSLGTPRCAPLATFQALALWVRLCSSVGGAKLIITASPA